MNYKIGESLDFIITGKTAAFSPKVNNIISPMFGIDHSGCVGNGL